MENIINQRMSDVLYRHIPVNKMCLIYKKKKKTIKQRYVLIMRLLASKNLNLIDLYEFIQAYRYA